MINEKLKEQKDKIMENINYAKSVGMNKVSAIILIEEGELQNELITWLIINGYKVSLITEEITVLTIEW